MGDDIQWTRFPAHSPEYYRKECEWEVNHVLTMEPKDTPAAGVSTRPTWYK